MHESNRSYHHELPLALPGPFLLEVLSRWQASCRLTGRWISILLSWLFDELNWIKVALLVPCVWQGNGIDTRRCNSKKRNKIINCNLSVVSLLTKSWLPFWTLVEYTHCVGTFGRPARLDLNGHIVVLQQPTLRLFSHPFWFILNHTAPFTLVSHISILPYPSWSIKFRGLTLEVEIPYFYFFICFAPFPFALLGFFAMEPHQSTCKVFPSPALAHLYRRALRSGEGLVGEPCFGCHLAGRSSSTASRLTDSLRE